MSNKIIYFDHAATTPLDPKVLESMLPYLTEEFGNPSSQHELGRKARNSVDDAREKIGDLISAHPNDIVFTGSGTEATNLAIVGSVLKSFPTRQHVIFSAIEHHSVLHTQSLLKKLGCEITLLPVNELGTIEEQTFKNALRPDTLLVSIMHANNEVGTIQNIKALTEISHTAGALFHTDAIQSAGYLPIVTNSLNIDFLSLSGHKIYGPKGIGALYIKPKVRVQPLMLGGGQERDLRAGTENIAAIVGFGKAALLAKQEMALRFKHVKSIRDHFMEQVLNAIPAAKLTGEPHLRLPNNAHFIFPNVRADSLLINLDRMGIAASSGSACSSGSIDPSHVLLAMGYSEEEAFSGIRFSFGKDNTIEEVDNVVNCLKQLIL